MKSLSAVCKKYLVATLLTAALPSMAAAQTQMTSVQLGSSINIKKVPGTELFAFEVCNASVCKALGSPRGYTQENIRSFNGRIQQILSGVLLPVEGVVIFMIGAAGAAYAAPAGFIASVGGLAAGWTLPTVAISYINAINPFEIYAVGDAKVQVESTVNQMVAKGEASVVLFSSPDLNETLEFAKQVEGVLNTLPVAYIAAKGPNQVYPAYRCSDGSTLAFKDQTNGVYTLTSDQIATPMAISAEFRMFDDKLVMFNATIIDSENTVEIGIARFYDKSLVFKTAETDLVCSAKE